MVKEAWEACWDEAREGVGRLYGSSDADAAPVSAAPTAPATPAAPAAPVAPTAAVAEAAPAASLPFAGPGDAARGPDDEQEAPREPAGPADYLIPEIALDGE